MTAVSLSNIIGQSLGSDQRKTQNAQQQAGRVDGYVAAFEPKVDGWDKVSLSNNVPAPLPARMLEEADALVEKMISDINLKKSDYDKLREDKVFRALVAMRLMERSAGGAKPVWTGGLPKPSQAEVDEAYRRLTQRVVNVADARDINATRQMRIDLLDHFRNQGAAAEMGEMFDDAA